MTKLVTQKAAHLKKSDLYSSLWASCDQLRGGMDASQYKDYILTLLFVKYVSDKAKSDPDSLIVVPDGGSFDDMLAVKGDKEIGDHFNKIIGKLAEANNLRNVIDQADFNDEKKLGEGKSMVDRLSSLVTIFKDLDFRRSRAEGDDLLGDAYEYLMRHFATESGKSKGQFYTPAEVSRILAKVVGIGPTTQRDQTVYDPACGSGSLLLKAAAEAPNGMSVYGQENDNATWALSKMNMILHGNEIAEIELGNTLANPKFLNGSQLKTFDYVVMNPPFSQKAWKNGVEKDYYRFEYGMPPEKNGDYAFLLHALKSLKSTGKAAVILPHGVLFRGNAEATIRTRLLKQGFIKGIIGLPANLFYGTGIPACIIILDKENAVGRTGVFMIDASNGFVKDGNKNRLRSQDIHRIVDTFNKQIEVEGYSRMVPSSEIADPKNNYNLNIPRYIDSSAPEDLQDLIAHLQGGIPDTDIELLHGYWDAFPELRSKIFTVSRPGYSKLTIHNDAVQQAIFDTPGFRKLHEKSTEIITTWFDDYRDILANINTDTRPNELITTISNDILERFKPVPLLDEYSVYDRLMDYWHGTVHDDVYLIMTDGWQAAAKPRLAINDKERKLTEEPDLVIGTGKNAQKYKMDLIPPSLVVSRYFTDEQKKLDELNTELEAISAAVTEHAEEYGVDEALLSEATNDKGAYTKQLLTAVIKTAGMTHDDEAIIRAKEALEMVEKEAAAKKAVKQVQAELDLATLKKYGDLSEDEIKDIVLDNKWQTAIVRHIASEVDALTLDLVARIQQLGERYDETIGHMNADYSKLEAKVVSHLAAMGIR